MAPQSIGAAVLRIFCRQPSGAPFKVEEDPEWSVEDALRILLRVDHDFSKRVKGKAVVDFGSGLGFQSAAFLSAGAAKVLGLEIMPHHRKHAEKLLAQIPRSDKAKFLAAPEPKDFGAYDLVVSQDAMEHYPDPAGALRTMHSLLRPGGEALITFGPPWLAPYGAHLRFITPLPWVHLLFGEASVMAVRQRYRQDGAKTYSEVPGGLNQMTLHRFESLLQGAGFSVVQRRYEGVKGMHILARLPLVREFFTNHITVLLRKA